MTKRQKTLQGASLTENWCPEYTKNKTTQARNGEGPEQTFFKGGNADNWHMGEKKMLNIASHQWKKSELKAQWYVDSPLQEWLLSK